MQVEIVNILCTKAWALELETHLGRQRLLARRHNVCKTARDQDGRAWISEFRDHLKLRNVKFHGRRTNVTDRS